MRLNRLFNCFLAVTLAFPVGPSFAQNVTIELPVGLKARVFRDGEMKREAYLGEGSTVQIPERYAICVNSEKKPADCQDTDNKPDFELTLNNWLSAPQKGLSKGKRAGIFTFDGEKEDYFFPVVVVKPGKNSSALAGQEFSVALRSLRRFGNEIITIKNEPIATSDSSLANDDQSPSNSSETSTQNATTLEATTDNGPIAKTFALREPQIYIEATPLPEVTTATGQCVDCQNEPLRNLKEDLGAILAKVDSDRTRKSNRMADGARTIKADLKRSCGLDFDEFKKEIANATGGDRAMADLLEMKMVLESNSRCFVHNSERDRSSSVGLFQINSRYTSVRTCTSAEKEKIKSSSLAQLRTSPQCLENPVVNLREAVSKLKEMEKYLFSTGTFDKSKTSDEDRQRMIVTAYNGGQTWVLEARRSLIEFNKIHHTNLNPNSWTDLRTFFFRQSLSNQQRARHFGKVSGFSWRNEGLLISNIAHAETLVPLRRSPSSGRQVARTSN